MGLLPNFIAKRPIVAENDFAGVIVDAYGSKWENGQEVFGFVDIREFVHVYSHRVSC